jgi:hypothetical protein
MDRGRPLGDLPSYRFRATYGDVASFRWTTGGQFFRIRHASEPDLPPQPGSGDNGRYGPLSVGPEDESTPSTAMSATVRAGETD